MVMSRTEACISMLRSSTKMDSTMRNSHPGVSATPTSPRPGRDHSRPMHWDARADRISRSGRPARKENPLGTHRGEREDPDGTLSVSFLFITFQVNKIHM